MTAGDLIKKFGKKKATEMMVHSPKNGRTGAEKDRGIKGRVRYRLCPHSVWIIENYEIKECYECSNRPRDTKAPDFKPGFNIGLGAWVESRSEERKIAKALRLVEAG